MNLFVTYDWFSNLCLMTIQTVKWFIKAFVGKGRCHTILDSNWYPTAVSWHIETSLKPSILVQQEYIWDELEKPGSFAAFFTANWQNLMATAAVAADLCSLSLSILLFVSLELNSCWCYCFFRFGKSSADEEEKNHYKHTKAHDRLCRTEKGNLASQLRRRELYLILLISVWSYWGDQKHIAYAVKVIFSRNVSGSLGFDVHKHFDDVLLRNYGKLILTFMMKCVLCISTIIRKGACTTYLVLHTPLICHRGWNSLYQYPFQRYSFLSSQ